MRLARIVSMLLLILCLLDVVRACALSAALSLTDDDDHNYSAALVSVLIVLGESYSVIYSSLAHSCAPCGSPFHLSSPQAMNCKGNIPWRV